MNYSMPAAGVEIAISLRGLSPGQTHLKYKNPLIARVLAFLNLAYFFVNILIQQGFQKYRAFALGLSPPLKYNDT
ncbi:MAG: hypothetical protein V7L06_11360 [Nostoc sp.]